MPSNAVFGTLRNSAFGDSIFRYSVMPLHTVPNAPMTIGIVLILRRFQHFWTSISRSRYLVIYSASFLSTLIHTGTDTLTNRYSLFFVSCMVISGLLHFTFLSVMILLSHSIFIPLCSTLFFGSCSVHDSVTLTIQIFEDPTMYVLSYLVMSVRILVRS